MPEKRLRVVHILGTLSYGGLQLRVLNLIKELPSFTHIVVFQSEEKGPLYPGYASVSDIQQCVYERGRTLDFFIRLRKLLREKDPDVVLAHLFGNHTLVALAGFLSGVPVTYGVSANDPVVTFKSFWKAMALAHSARPFSRGEIAVGEAVGRILVSRLHLPSQRVTVISNGVRVEEIAARAATARESAGQKRDGVARALMAANIVRNKDHRTAIRAIQLLRDQGREVELQLAGSIFSERGRSRVATLPDELGIRDLIQFLGARTDVPELMGASDVLVHASNSEGFSNVVLEGMAAGVPIVATDIPPSRDALDGGRCGLLVPPRDASALAEAIRQILDDEPLRLRLVAAAFERVRSHYHVKRMAADYSKLLLARS